MADSFNKKEREKKRRKRKKDKKERKQQKKLDGVKGEEFMYVDENGNLTSTPPEEQERTEIKLENIKVSTPKQSEIAEEDPIRNGVVKFYNPEKRFGFIKEIKTGNEFFVHGENVKGDIDLQENDKVEYEIGNGHKGPVAINVSIVNS